MQQQPAPSQDEGVPPAAATDAREAQEPPVAAQPPPAPSTPTAAPPLKTKMCAELELLLAMVTAAGPEIDLAAAMVHVSRAQVAVAAALGAASAELVDQTADDEPTAADDDDDAPPADAPPLPLGSDEFPDEALAVVCRFLGLRGLGRLACAARRFTEPTLTEPGGARLLSPIEEGARLRLAAATAGGGGGGASGGAAAERLVDETWVRALWRVQYRLLFTSCGPKVVLSEEGTVATIGGYSFQSAVCAEHPMVAGAHYVEMTLLEKGRHGGAYMGVVGQGFDAAGGGLAFQSAEGWLLSTDSGFLLHAGRASNWEGKPQEGEIKPGDVVGLLLDLGQRTLSLYLNGARRGVMVAPGMKNRRGEAVASLAGPLRWAVDVGGGASARIARRPAPGPVPSAEEVAAAVAWSEANWRV